MSLDFGETPVQYPSVIHRMVHRLNWSHVSALKPMECCDIPEPAVIHWIYNWYNWAYIPALKPMKYGDIPVQWPSVIFRIDNCSIHSVF